MVLLVLLIIIEALRICLSWRSEGDSNPRAACDDYTLSRRASSATRASFHYACKDTHFLEITISGPST